ncbi:hypothetical protein [Gluconacetobacter aggeris]|uniref:hypothetical protein n=1 Tax=Gluconacetobacter aggeris TaxID=1286186 RepID=UPI0016036D3C|nr:hypothetical protein [Gluconacetobacter aggeris]
MSRDQGHDARHRAWPASAPARSNDWFAKGVLKYHRRMATTLNTLTDTGFALRRIDECAPTQKQIAQMPTLAEEIERPMMLLMSATRP